MSEKRKQCSVCGRVWPESRTFTTRDPGATEDFVRCQKCYAWQQYQRKRDLEELDRLAG